MNYMKSFSLLLFLFSFLIYFGIENSYAHPSKNHKPLICIPEEDRTKTQLQRDKTNNFFHRLSKLQQDCAMVELEKQ